MIYNGTQNCTVIPTKEGTVEFSQKRVLSKIRLSGLQQQFPPSSGLQRNIDHN